MINLKTGSSSQEGSFDLIILISIYSFQGGFVSLERPINSIIDYQIGRDLKNHLVLPWQKHSLDKMAQPSVQLHLNCLVLGPPSLLWGDYSNSWLSSWKNFLLCLIGISQGVTCTHYSLLFRVTPCKICKVASSYLMLNLVAKKME